jgi:hypothetical protein
LLQVAYIDHEQSILSFLGGIFKALRDEVLSACDARSAISITLADISLVFFETILDLTVCHEYHVGWEE